MVGLTRAYTEATRGLVGRRWVHCRKLKRTPLVTQRVRAGLRNRGTKTMQANDSRGQESPDRPTRCTDGGREPTIYAVEELPADEKGDACAMYSGDPPTRCGLPAEFVFVHEASLDPEDDRRRNCLCCAQCKPVESVVTDGGKTTDGGSLYPDVNPHTGGNAWLIRQIAVDLGLVTYWNGDCPEALTNPHRRLGIGHIVGEGPPAVSGFQKADLVAIAAHLTDRPKRGFYDQTTSELRALISEEVGVAYDPDRSTPFRKDELGAILMECARIDFRQDGGPA